METRKIIVKSAFGYIGRSHTGVYHAAFGSNVVECNSRRGIRNNKVAESGEEIEVPARAVCKRCFG